jgi:hypothetical protein
VGIMLGESRKPSQCLPKFAHRRWDQDAMREPETGNSATSKPRFSHTLPVNGYAIKNHLRLTLSVVQTTIDSYSYSTVGTG